MKRLILFLIRRKLGLAKYQIFQYTNQRSNSIYFINETGIWKFWTDSHGRSKFEKSHVSVNWVLSDGCEIIKY